MTDIWQFHQNGRAFSRMGGATSFPYPALSLRFKGLLINVTRGAQPRNQQARPMLPSMTEVRTAKCALRYASHAVY